MEPNPYQSPAFPTCVDPVLVPPPVVAFDPVQVRALVRPPAVVLIVLAALALLYDVAGFSYMLLVEAPKSVSDFSSVEGLVVAGSIVVGFGLFMFVHAFIIFGMTEMWRLRSRNYVSLAMAIAIVPSISPGYVLGIPIAIWIYQVLKKPDVQAAFDYQFFRDNSPRQSQ